MRQLLVAVLIGVLCGAARWTYECRLVVTLVPDPQSPIWVVLSGITSSFIAATVSVAAWFAMRSRGSRSSWWQIASCAPLVLLLVWYGSGFVALARMRTALLDAADPATGADRLRELADFTGGPGYEIDNRVARHPNTPADVLRALAGRPDQVGTDMCLAENPHTPDDVLRTIASREGQWTALVRTALRRNPRYVEVFGEGEPVVAPASAAPAGPASSAGQEADGGPAGADGGPSGRSTR